MAGYRVNFTFYLYLFMKICRKNPNLAKTEQKYWAFYVQKYVLL